MNLTEPREIELKLSLRQEDRPALERHLVRQADRSPEEREELTTYFDTPRLTLAKQGYSLRVRQSGSRHIQTLKSARDGCALAASRGEWEWSLDGDTPDLTRLAEIPCAADFLVEAQTGLEPVFQTQIRRTIHSIDLPGGAAVEVAFDVGTVSSGTAWQDVSEFELELKRGLPGSLYRLALELHDLAPFTIGAESKAERGRRLRTNEPPRAVETRPPKLHPGEPAAAAIRRIVTGELGHLLANHPAATVGDVEGVHQMRIGIRRLRTLLALFGKHLNHERTVRWEAELKRLGQVFGATRDWDVFCTKTLLAAAEIKGSKGCMSALQASAEWQRRLAHEALQQELGRPALTGLILAMAAWAEPDSEDAICHLDSHQLQRPLAKLIPGLLDSLARRVEKRGGHFKRCTAAELHRFRKSLKKLRYSVEFMSAFYPTKQVRQYSESAKGMLKLLGDANDAQVASALAKPLEQSDQRDISPAISCLTEWNDTRVAKARRKLPKAWDAFAAKGPVWR